MSNKYQTIQVSRTVSVTELVAAHYYEFPKSFSFAPETHSFWEIAYVDRGEARILLNGESYTVRAGEMIIYPPFARHSVPDSDGIPNTCGIVFSAEGTMLPISGRVISLSESQQQIIGRVISLSGQLSPDGILQENIRQLRQEIEPRGRILLSLIASYIEILIEELLIETSQQHKNAEIHIEHHTAEFDRSDKQLMKELCTLVRKNPEINFTTEELCRRLLVGETALYRCVRRQTGSGIKKLLIDEKLTAVKRMIRQEQYNVTQIADMTGFSGICYFSTWFKRHVGMSPTEYATSVKTKYAAEVMEQ